MELTTIFTGLVLAVGIFHVIAQASNFIRRYLFSGGSKVVGVSRKATSRDDWYMFFHCSDLTGERREKNQVDDRNDHLPTHTNTATTKMDRRKQSRRLAC